MKASLFGGPYDGTALDHNDINLYTRFSPVGMLELPAAFNLINVTLTALRVLELHSNCGKIELNQSRFVPMNAAAKVLFVLPSADAVTESQRTISDEMTKTGLRRAAHRKEILDDEPDVTNRPAIQAASDD